MPDWTTRQIPDQRGRVFVVTGANSGIGLEAARELSGAGASVVLACRSAKKAEAAAASIRRSFSNAELEILPLDLADLASVQSFAKQFAQNHSRLDVLINNAGIMAIPRHETVDGFEMQFGTNHLGHFALTGLLFEHL
ncbi:MAG: SDR family NAD(P)-dependent oxidoreductase, partial [bacterium]|nr:SDR family NAD(P)-dependent oxidoreductase [bacterium]